MKKRLLALMFVAVIFSITAIGSFASPITTPCYDRYFSEDLKIKRGQAQDVYVGASNKWILYTCPSCGQSTWKNNVLQDVRNNDVVEGDIFVFADYNTYWIGYGTGRMCRMGAVNDTSQGCVVTRGKGVWNNVDIASDGYVYVHRAYDTMSTTAYDTPTFGAIINGTSALGQRLTENLENNEGAMANGALRLNVTNFAYDLVYISGSNSAYADAYQHGFYEGKIQGQEDAQVLLDISDVLNGVFGGIGSFFDPILDLGVFGITVQGIIELMLSLYLALLIIRIIRG